MKKTFYQLHVQAFYIRIIHLIIISSGIFLIIDGIIRANILSILVGLLPALGFLSSYYSIFYNRIIFHDEIIEITGEKGKNTEKLQVEDKITYWDIDDIHLIYSNKNFRKKHPSSHHIGNLRPSMFFEFVLKNQKTKWVCISSFSKKQRKEMLEIINSKTGKNFSYDTLEREDLSIYNFKKSKKSK